jgi:hypothetical protein
VRSEEVRCGRGRLAPFPFITSSGFANRAMTARVSSTGGGGRGQPTEFHEVYVTTAALRTVCRSRWGIWSM